MDLGSLNLEGIENIINSMSQQDIEQLTALAGEFFSSGDKQERVSKEEKAQNAGGIDFDTVTRIASLISKLSSQTRDPGCELLAALKPMLSPERQHKADEAIKMIQLISLLPLLKDLQ